MNNRAIYLSVEAIISLIILISILALPSESREQNLDDLHVLQKQNDLLKVWTMERDFSAANLESDFLFVFPQQSGLVEFENKKIEIGKSGSLGNYKKSVASGYYIDDELRMKEIRLIVYY